MKRIISLLLIVIMSCSALVGCDWKSIFNWGANSNDKVDEDLKMKEAYISQFKIDGVEAKDVVIDYDGGTYNGARVVMLDAEWHDREHWTEIIDEISIQYYDANRILVYKLNEFYTLEEAKDSDILSLEQIILISNDFQSKVAHYRDTCDKFDFSEFWIWEPDEEYSEFVKYDKIDIRIDRDIVFTDENREENLIKYLGEDIIKRVVSEGRVSEDYVGYALELHVPGEENIQYVFERLSQVPGVLSAGYYVRYGMAAQATNDSYNEYNGSWWMDNIEIEKVWSFTTGSYAVSVGIIDSGIYPHSALEDNLSIECNFYDESFGENPNYDLSHATFLAGIIGGNGNDNFNFSGVNHNVSIVSLRVEDPNSLYGGAAHPSELCIEAIEYVNDRYRYYDSLIDVLNFSLANYSYNQSMREEISEYQGLFVVAAGNFNQEICAGTSNQYPALYNLTLDNMLVVGAIDENDNRWYDNANSGSNYGDVVDIYAPGVNVLSTYPNSYSNNDDSIPNGYKVSTGTSYATAYVSGVAALLLSINPELTTAQLKECILEGADTIRITVGTNNNEYQSVKKLNAWGSFKYLMYHYPKISHTLRYDDVQFTDEIYTYGRYYNEHTSMAKLNILVNRNYTFTVSSNDAINVTVYDSSFEEVEIPQTITNNGSRIEFSYTFPKGTYYMETNYVNEDVEGTITVNIDTLPHTHEYTEWTYHSPTHHIESCECGLKGTLTSMHVIKAGTIVNLRAPCMYCGAIILIGNDFVQVGPANLTKVTLNGSYILPNGIIVLVDEDIEAYENGTLVWYDKDDLPQTQ